MSGARTTRPASSSRSPRPSRSSRSSRRPRGRAGVTLIELMVALFVLGVALFALAAVSLQVTRQLAGGGRQTLAATIAQSRLDSLASIAPCSGIVSAGGSVRGTHTTRGVREAWVIRDGDNVIYVTDSLSFAGRTNPLVYESILVCRN
ncbi:MAG TPA: prepilin-type N-terminal cleavage/methylation domain-containing protein [Gemmatimonadaceae bacterium]|nr:prepilin-type N-terminal cleavage/methylation domain-containing protein [Gemmatimonadaceae bacterium]